jgi:hypothetical protein
MPLGDVYSTGTASVNAGSTTVTGTTVVWTDVVQGDEFRIGSVAVPIASAGVGFDTLTLAVPWPGTNQVNTSYLIDKRSVFRLTTTASEFLTKFRKFVTDLAQAGLFLFVDTGDEPDPQLGEEGQWALRPATFTIWHKQSGIWIEQPPPEFGSGAISGLFDNAFGSTPGFYLQRDEAGWVGGPIDGETLPNPDVSVRGGVFANPASGNSVLSGIDTDGNPTRAITTGSGDVVRRTTPLIDSPNVLTQYSLNSVKIIDLTGGGPQYTTFYSVNGRLAARFGDAGDPSNIWRATTHKFTSSDGSATFSDITSGGLRLYGFSSGSILLSVPTVAGSNTVLFPAVTDTVVCTANVATFFNKTFDTAAAFTNTLKINGTVVSDKVGTGKFVLDTNPIFQSTIDLAGTGLIRLGGFPFANYNGGDYNLVYSPSDARLAVQIGGTSDRSNYYKANKHGYANADGTVTLEQIDTSGHYFFGPTSGLTLLRPKAVAAGVLDLPAETGTLVSTGSVNVVTNAMLSQASRKTFKLNSGNTTGNLSDASAAVASQNMPMRGQIAGLTLSTAGGTGTFGIAVGQATDDGNTEAMVLASAFTKTTAAWAVGSGNGSLDAGSIAANTWYHVFLIKRTDTGVVDVLISANATTPTMPGSYTLKRRIGSMRTDGSSQWIKFFQYGDDFTWDVPIASYINGSVGTTRITNVTCRTPIGLRLEAKISANVYNISTNTFWMINSVEQADTAPASNSMFTVTGSVGNYTASTLRIRTNTNAEIAARSDTGSSILIVVTNGWNDRRGKDD